MDSAPRYIEIEVEPGGVPISGRVHVRGEAVRPFTGWTALFAALRAAVGEETVAPGHTGGGGPIETRGGRR